MSLLNTAIGRQYKGRLGRYVKKSAVMLVKNPKATLLHLLLIDFPDTCIAIEYLGPNVIVVIGGISGFVHLLGVRCPVDNSDNNIG